MSQHSQRTQHGPSLGSVLWGAGMSLVSLAGTVYTATGRITGQEIAGVILGLALTVLLAGQTLGRLAERDEVAFRDSRQKERAEAELKERARHTATWEGTGIGHVLAVRYDPSTGLFHVQGWLGGDWHVYPERQWWDTPGLARMIALMEGDGRLTADKDEVTAEVRRRLGLPGVAAPAWPLPVDGEEAITSGPIPVPTGPSEVALTQVPVPLPEMTLTWIDQEAGDPETARLYVRRPA